MDINLLKKSIAEIGNTLKQNEDWSPVAILRRPDGEMTVIQFPCALMNITEGKDLVLRCLASAIDDFQATQCAVVSSGWLWPDSMRQEVVMIQFYDGPLQIAELHYAQIMRHHRIHPGLGPWIRVANAIAEGRFPETIVPALRKFRLAA